MNGHIIILDGKLMRPDESESTYAYRILPQRILQNADLVAVSFEGEKEVRIIKKRSLVGVWIDHSSDMSKVEVVK